MRFTKIDDGEWLSAGHADGWCVKLNRCAPRHWNISVYKHQYRPPSYVCLMASGWRTRAAAIAWAVRMLAFVQTELVRP